MRDAQFPDFRIPSRDYLDLWVGYRFPPLEYGDLTLRAGAENLLDTEPPIFPSYVQANTDPSLYDTLGRRYYLRLNYRL
jgi:outer membrane receptor protein involved in Fe transport